MSGTQVVNIRSGQPYDVYIGRPSVFGNPFVIDRDGTRAEVVAKFRERARHSEAICTSLHLLRGKVLGCYCKPQECHGDVYVDMIAELDAIDVDWADRMKQWTNN